VSTTCNASASERASLNLAATIRFFVLTYGISLLGWAPILIFGLEMNGTLGTVFLAVGGLGPAIASFVLVRRESAEVRREHWKRIVEVGRIPKRWFTFIVLLPTLLLPEEVGWRGYALPQLENLLSPPLAALVLGVLWVGWHTPLFFMHGSLLAAMYPFRSAAFVGWSAGLISLSFIMSVVHRRTRSSTLAAILLHFAFNATAGLLRPPVGTMISLFVLSSLTELTMWSLFRADEYCDESTLPWSPS
jgi:uncharacterized protein